MSWRFLSATQAPFWCMRATEVSIICTTVSLSPLLVLIGPHAMSAIGPESAPKRTFADHPEFYGFTPLVSLGPKAG
jgi:hypothetical protein